MPRVSAERRLEAISELLEGADIGETADKYGVSFLTAQKWATEGNTEPLGVAPPNVTVGAAKGATRARKGKAAPITEETAQVLISGLFTMAAVISQEPLLMLDDHEKKALGLPFADSLRILPQPVADAVNTYSAPAIFSTTLFTVLQVKMRKIAEKKARTAQGIRTIPAPAPKAAPNGVASPPPRPSTQAPPVDFSTAVDADLASVLDAARGGLSEAMDETEMSMRGYGG